MHLNKPFEWSMPKATWVCTYIMQFHPNSGVIGYSMQVWFVTQPKTCMSGYIFDPPVTEQQDLHRHPPSCSRPTMVLAADLIVSLLALMPSG